MPKENQISSEFTESSIGLCLRQAAEESNNGNFDVTSVGESAIRTDAGFDALRGAWAMARETEDEGEGIYYMARLLAEAMRAGQLLERMRMISLPQVGPAVHLTR